jgi:hypothetical protein
MKLVKNNRRLKKEESIWLQSSNTKYPERYLNLHFISCRASDENKQR